MAGRFINLTTGEVKQLDQLEPVPEGFEEVEFITEDEWIEALQNLAKEVEIEKGQLPYSIS